MSKKIAAMITRAQRAPLPVGRGPRGSGEVLRPGKSNYESTNVPGVKADASMQLTVSDDSQRPKPPGSPIAPLIQPEARGRVVPKAGEFNQPNTDLIPKTE